MKLSPMAAGQVAVNSNEGASAGPDRLAKAKAIASGRITEVAPDRGPPQDPQVDRAQSSIKKIKMRTQVSQDRHLRVEEPTTPQEVLPDTLATTEQVAVASEETKPLSPQFAALARQKREIQLERQKLNAEKAALVTESGDKTSLAEYKARIKANALSVLQEEGVTYDQLTEQILADNGSNNADLSAIKAEIKALKDGFDNRLSERDVLAETQVKTQIRRTVDQLVATGDDFEMVREAGYAPKVVDLIDKIWKKEGILLDESEATAMVEKELLEESLKFAKLGKVQRSLNPAQVKQTQPVQLDRPNTKIMRTLTNRDGASSTMGKRERAIAAMEGRLK